MYREVVRVTVCSAESKRSRDTDRSIEKSGSLFDRFKTVNRNQKGIDFFMKQFTGSDWKGFLYETAYRKQKGKELIISRKLLQ